MGARWQMQMLALQVVVPLVLILQPARGDDGVGQLPIVLWHGMGDSCYNDLSMGRLKGAIRTHLGEGSYVKLLCFGNSIVEDSASGFIANANEQVETACKAIAADDKLRNGYHAIGFSQGGQFLRAVAQRCPFPPMKTLVSIGGQHQGVYGLPHCKSGFVCDSIRKLLSVGAYWGLVQGHLVQAQYWHDARSAEKYRRGSSFIAEINNDVEDPSDRKRSYVDNLTQLERLVLVRFNKDTMVVPLDSQWFEFYAPGSSEEILPLEESAIYKEDWIGLRQLAESGRLVRLSVDGDHLRFSLQWLLADIVDKYLTPPAPAN